MDEVARSIRVSSTSGYWTSFVRSVGFTLGGLVAGEGCFTIGQLGQLADGTPRLRFRFLLTMAERDRPLVDALRNFLGYGSIHRTPPRRAGWQALATLTIASRRAHHAATIPFAERYLLPDCAKRSQFEAWRDTLYEHEKARPFPRPRSICSVGGCERFVRGRGLCRRHYYRVTGY